MKRSFKVFYDQSTDVLYLVKPGIEEEVLEIHPGINLELDEQAGVIGIESMKASEVLRPAVQSLQKQAAKRQSTRWFTSLPRFTLSDPTLDFGRLL